jgi:hypothetical protein
MFVQETVSASQIADMLGRNAGLDVGKTENSPVGVEALMKAEKQVGYTYSKAPILESSFPTRQETARSVPS